MRGRVAGGTRVSSQHRVAHHLLHRLVDVSEHAAIIIYIYIYVCVCVCVCVCVACVCVSVTLNGLCVCARGQRAFRCRRIVTNLCMVAGARSSMSAAPICCHRRT